MEKESRENIDKKYAYLEELPLEGFLWEFIRRNKEYKKAYEEYQNNRRDYDKLIFDPARKNDETELSWFVRTQGRRFRAFKMLFSPFGLAYPLDPTKRADDRDFYPLCFFSDDFQKDERISLLCNEIRKDAYEMVLRKPDLTVEWLNEILRTPNFYDIWSNKKRWIGSNLLQRINQIVSATRRYRSKRFQELTELQKYNILTEVLGKIWCPLQESNLRHQV